MIEFKIPDTAFTPTGPLPVERKSKTKIVLDETGPTGVIRYRYEVTVNPLVIMDEQFESDFRASRENLVTFVAKGLVEIRHDGTLLTPQQIRDFHF